MGEYAYYHGERVKIGTCEDLGYLRADHVPLLSTRDRHDTNVMEALDVFRFRFPWPDEDHMAPGDYDNMDRSVGLHGAKVLDGLDHYSVQFKSTHPDHYLVSLPCPEDSASDFKGFRIARNGFSGSVHIAQQRVWGNRLVLVARCGGCGTAYRLETLEQAESIIEECREKAAREVRDLELQNNREHAAGRPGYDPERNAGAKFWTAIADRIVAGYTNPPEWIAIRPARANTETS
jgi:hypothetical protein